MRFGLEPTWAYRTLSNLGVPDAVRITRRARLLDARAVGATTATVLGLVPVAFLAANLFYEPRKGNALAIALILFAILLVILLVRIARALTLGSDSEFTAFEREYYAQVAQLLELHRFDLYRALAVDVPASAGDERRLAIPGWRQGGDIKYAIPAASGPGDVQEQVAEIADLLRGPQLVAYDGYISWEVTESQVRLTFAGDPVSGAEGTAPLQVEGAGTEAHAPFDVTANSQDVNLDQVRARVPAPTNGRPATAAFTFTRGPDLNGAGASVIWLEIRQRGRFIQLLRVQAAAAPEQQVPDA
jgi:hypothetical protein